MATRNATGRVHTVAAGVSAGGIESLRRLVGQLPSDFSAGVLVVLHLLDIGPPGRQAASGHPERARGNGAEPLELDAVNRRGKAARTMLRAPLANNGDDVRGAIVMMGTSDG